MKQYYRNVFVVEVISDSKIQYVDQDALAEGILTTTWAGRVLNVPHNEPIEQLYAESIIEKCDLPADYFTSYEDEDDVEAVDEEEEGATVYGSDLDYDVDEDD